MVSSCACFPGSWGTRVGIQGRARDARRDEGCCSRMLRCRQRLQHRGAALCPRREGVSVRKFGRGFFVSAPRGSPLEASRSSALTGVKNMAGESKREGDRPRRPKDAHTSAKPGAWWGGCCPFCGLGGFSTRVECCRRHGARCPPHLRGEGFGERCKPRCFWQGILVAWRVGHQPQRGAAGGSGAGSQAGEELGRVEVPGKGVFFFQLSRQEPRQAEAASGGLSLPDVAVPALRWCDTTVLLLDSSRSRWVAVNSPMLPAAWQIPGQSGICWHWWG